MNTNHHFPRLAALIAAVLALAAAPIHAQQYQYSVDIGSDTDASDPLSPGFLDAADIYVEVPVGPPTLVKNDDNTDGGGTPTVGYIGSPLTQPPPTLIGAGAALTADAVRDEYDIFFDLDATDQLGIVVLEPNTHLRYSPTQRSTLLAAGVYFEPLELAVSFDDDLANGWFKTSSVPTIDGPPRDNGDPVGAPGSPFYEIDTYAGTYAPGGFSPVPIAAAQRTETAIGLPADPITTAQDDDVDALDNEQHRYHYWSADHEANAGYDPGGIYLTDLALAGANAVQALDEVDFDLALPADADIDAFEFILISEDTYITLFGENPGGGPATGDDVLVALFSVDENDPDNDGPPADDFHGDESGNSFGSNPKVWDASVLYLSDLQGASVAISTSIPGQDLDAVTIAVPEPGSALLVALAGLALAAVRRGR